MTLGDKLLQEAKSIAFGLYSANARNANRYGFVGNSKDGITYGEFLFPGESEKHVDWIIELPSANWRKAKE